MKVEVNFDNFHDYYGDALSNTIKEAIESELRSEIRKITKETFKKHRDKLAKAIDKMNDEQIAKLLKAANV